MENGNTLIKYIIAKQPRVTIVAGPQTIYFRNNKRKCRAKIAAQAQIQILSITVAEVVIENEKNNKQPDKRSLGKIIQKYKAVKINQRK